MAYNGTNPVSVGAATKKDHYDRAFDNTVALYAGALGLTSQAALDFLYASSATQMARLAKGSGGQVVRLNSAGTAYEFYTPGGGLGQSFKGHLRTHPDADKAAYQTWGKFKEVVFDDGFRIKDTDADLDGLVWDLTVSGSGGLDTGSEGASRWYEKYLIHRAQDAASVAPLTLLHRAKNFFLDESQTTDTSNERVIMSTGSRTAVAQTFDTDVTGYVEFVDVKIGKNNSPTGQMWAELRATSAGAPTGAALATSDKLDVAVLPTGSNLWVRFIFRSPISLTAGTTYALVLTSNHAASDTVNLHWNENNAGGYAAGEQYKLEGGSWSAFGAGDDFCFKVYVTENDAAVTMPAGYDQKCLVGYVYNDSGSNFDPFVAIDHDVEMRTADLASVTSTVPLLTDCSIPLPPCRVRASVTAYGTANTRCGVGGVPDGYEDYGAIAMARTDLGANGNTVPVGHVITETQGLYLYVSAGTTTFQVRGYRW